MRSDMTIIGFSISIVFQYHTNLLMKCFWQNNVHRHTTEVEIHLHSRSSLCPGVKSLYIYRACIFILIHGIPLYNVTSFQCTPLNSTVIPTNQHCTLLYGVPNSPVHHYQPLFRVLPNHVRYCHPMYLYFCQF